MNNRLDNYFKERVHQHETAPSSEAWGKIEARRSKKNSKVTLLRIAAGIAAIGLISVMMIDLQKDAPSQKLSQQNNEQRPARNLDKVKEPKSQTRSSDTKELKKSHTQVRKIDKQADPKEKNIDLQATVTPDPVVLESNEARQIASLVEQEKPKAKRIVIVYTLPTINKASQQNAVAGAEEKRTGLQKVMDVAMEVRASDIPLGQLREAKDDLFAFELKRDKTKTKTNN
jgi:hypothetical protein